MEADVRLVTICDIKLMHPRKLMRLFERGFRSDTYSNQHAPDDNSAMIGTGPAVGLHSCPRTYISGCLDQVPRPSFIHHRLFNPSLLPRTQPKVKTDQKLSNMHFSIALISLVAAAAAAPVANGKCHSGQPHV